MNTNMSYNEMIIYHFKELIFIFESQNLMYDEIRSIVGDELINRLIHFIPFSTDEADEN